MRDFDTERASRNQTATERTFKIGGEKFVRRASVRPEATEAWEDLEPFGKPQAEVLAVVDQTICNLVEPGTRGEAHKRWKALRERADDPVTLRDLVGVRNEETGELVQEGLLQWLLAEMSGRPTRQRSDSSDERAETGGTSTPDSTSTGLRVA